MGEDRTHRPDTYWTVDHALTTTHSKTRIKTWISAD